MGGVVIGILVWQEGGEFVGVLIAVGLVALGSLARWLVRRKREGKPTLLDPDLFKHDLFRLGISAQMLQNIALGGAMIALPIYLQMVLEYNALQTGLTLAPLSLTMFGTALVAGKRGAGDGPASIIRAGFALLTVGMLLLIPIVPRADSGLGARDPVDHRRTRTGPAGVPAQQLHALADLRRARQRGRRRQLRRRLLRAVVRARVRRRDHAGDALDRVHQKAEDSTVPAGPQEQVADALEDDAEVMSNTQLEEQLAGQPEAIQDEIIRINTDARPLALQVALLVPILAGLLGLLNGFRMMRRPDPVASGGSEAVPARGQDLGRRPICIE